MSGPAFGRRFAPDERDRPYALATLVAQAPEPTRRWRYWNANGWWGDQGGAPHCVGYAWAHWLEDGPVTHRGPAPVADPARLYRMAQCIDEWPGEDYAGTSVRAGAKVLHAEGFIEAYLWAFDAATVIDALLTVGPVVVGTDWYGGMSDPEPDGRLRPDGPLQGGHAYLLDGVNLDTGRVRVKNSWGRDWGRRGFGWLDLDDLDRLIAAQGEACLAVEVRP
jgi:hypothetical protein